MTSPEDRDSNAQIEAIQQARDALCVRAAELMAARLYVNRHDYDDTAFDKLEDLLGAFEQDARAYVDAVDGKFD